MIDDLPRENWPPEFRDLIEALGTYHVVFENSDYQDSAAGGDDPRYWLTPGEWLRQTRDN